MDTIRCSLSRHGDQPALLSLPSTRVWLAADHRSVVTWDAGKTTLLRLIAGLEEPTSGRVLFDGEDITALGVQERDLGFVFQVRLWSAVVLTCMPPARLCWLACGIVAKLVQHPRPPSPLPLPHLRKLGAVFGLEP